MTVRLPIQLRERIKASARRNGLRESDLVRRAVEQQLASEDDSFTAYEHARKAGLIGIVKRARKDLSTNPRYFHGFGES